MSPQEERELAERTRIKLAEAFADVFSGPLGTMVYEHLTSEALLVELCAPGPDHDGKRYEVACVEKNGAAKYVTHLRNQLSNGIILKRGEAKSLPEVNTKNRRKEK